MISLIRKNWLVIIFIIVLFLGGLTTAVLKWRPICGTTYKGAVESLKKNGPGVETVSDIITVAESAFTENIWGKSYWIEALGLFNRLSGKSIVLDTQDRYNVYKMSNGQETWNYTGFDLSKAAKRYNKFASDMHRRNIPLLYVQAPFKIDKYNNELPYGIKDETNPCVDNFLTQIADNDYLDLREVMHEEIADYRSMFYETDHHWTTEAGMWATGVVVDKLKKEYNLDLDDTYLTSDWYTFTTYKDYMLGSQGKRAGIIYSGLDDFTLIEPKYETSYQVDIPVKDIKKSGSYQETILFTDYLKRDYYNGDPGRVYAGDNYAQMKIVNNNSSNETRLLLVKDSYARAVIPTLASTCRELHALDLRTFEGSVSEYASDNHIDMVLVLYNPSVVVHSRFFDFYN